MTGLVNLLHSAEIPAVLAVQGLTPLWLQSALETYTEWIHPATAFTVVAPLLFGLRMRTTAVHFLLVACMSDLANLVLKWGIAGDRPYWASDAVRQYPMTCEAGYGFPSGHVQAFTAATYFLLTRWSAPRAVLAVHALFVVTGAYSRVYTGAHFPSQTAAGWVIGGAFGLCGHLALSASGLAARLSDLRPMRRAVPAAGLLVACACCVLTAYLLLLQVGSDPLGSLPKARGACVSSRGVVGLAFESAARVFGIMAGAVAVVAWAPLGPEAGAPPLKRVLLVLAVVLLSRRLLDAGEVRASASYGDGADGPASVCLAAVFGFVRVASTALLASVVSLVDGVAPATKDR